MDITIADIEWVGKLARLTLTEKEKEYYACTLSQIFEYVEMLNEVDTSMVQETSQVTGIMDRTRSDESKIINEHERQALINQFTDSETNFLKVPAVFKKT